MTDKQRSKERYAICIPKIGGRLIHKQEVQNALRAAADRLEAAQPAPDSGELQRLRDENAKLRVDTIMPMQAEIDLWRDRAEWLLGEMRKEADRG